ncbi:uncharacterized protein LOC111643912 [Copidosoma floridanum]|uniref:uncharacterized protein LOC111643912 n=1 Tax=Copidosoma floridanum TaxID=29053 RepID=UPI000C6FC6C2|nr:uncharacterized protein LOC111643912 [Copidosoma floridanum]
MENFVKAQEALRQPIANAFANFKKVGQSKMTKGLAKSHIARLNERYDRLKQNHGNISKARDYDSQHVYVTSDLFETISDEYYNSLGAFNDFMEQFETPALLDESLLNRTGQAPSSFNPLPKVDIPNFSGDLNDWEPFKDLFRSMIHRRTDITPVVKFHHLRFHLSGESAELIKSLLITVDNYEVAWDILTKNYGSQR